MLQQIQKHATLLAGLFYLVLLTLFFLSDIETRPIWMDEVCSYYQVRGRSFTEFLDSMKAGVNFMPYLYFIILWGVDQLFGLGSVLLRMPSLIFALTAVMVMHRLLAWRWGVGVAFMSCVSALLLSKDFALYSHEARPYALYMLAGAFALTSATRLLRQGAGRTTLIYSGCAAFLLPATHYVGIFYSLLILAALLLAGCRKGRVWLLSVTGSFGCGWLLFAVLHFSQILSHANNHSGMNWIPTPGISQVYEAVLKALAVPSAAVAVLLAYIGYQLFTTNSGQRPVARVIDHSQHQDTDRFWFVVALSWLLLPPLFTLFAAVGLPNLSVSRYFVPSLLAGCIVVAMLLAAGKSKWLEEDNALTSSWRPASLGVVIVLGFCAYPLLAATGHVALAILGKADKSAQEDYTDIAKSAMPGVTNNIHLFLEYNFHQRNGQRLSLLRKTAEETISFPQIDSSLSLLAVDELQTLPAFRYFYRKGTVNSFPDFDIRAWADQHGFAIVAEGSHNGMDLYLLTKLQPAGHPN